MSTKTYSGSCACGRVAFEADFDLAAEGTGKCNCTTCFKRRHWTVRVQPENFRYLRGESELVPFRDTGRVFPDGFCRHCGVTLVGYIPAAEWNEGAFLSVFVATLDNISPAELLEAPIRYMDGRNDDWWHPPAETRHL